MRKYFLFLSFGLTITLGFSQNDLFFSHQALMPAYYNPAWVGSSDIGALSVVYRNQWTGYVPTDASQGGAPTTQLLNLSLPASGLPIAGIGVNVSNDKLGAETNFQMQISTSIKWNLRFGVLQVGIMPGLYSKTIGDQLDPNDPTDGAIPNGRESQVKFNLGGGLYFRDDKGSYLGLGILNALQPNFDFGLSNANILEKRTFVLHGGLFYQLGDNFSLIPNVNIRTNLIGISADLGALLYYKSRLWTGLAYRKEEAAILYLGYGLLQNKLKIGYSFDYIVENKGAKSATSHEIFIRYNLPELVLGGRKTIKTPRFVF